jgi:hypothetical protein
VAPFSWGESPPDGKGMELLHLICKGCIDEPMAFQKPFPLECSGDHLDDEALTASAPSLVVLASVRSVFPLTCPSIERKPYPFDISRTF